MRHPQAINPSYRCQRVNANGLMQILNKLSYVFAEYNEYTGALTWLRVLPAPDKASIEKWLAEQHPARDAAGIPKKSKKAA